MPMGESEPILRAASMDDAIHLIGQHFGDLPDGVVIVHWDLTLLGRSAVDPDASPKMFNYHSPGTDLWQLRGLLEDQLDQVVEMCGRHRSRAR